MARGLSFTTATPKGFYRCRAVKGTLIAHLRASADGTRTVCGLRAVKVYDAHQLRPYARKACGNCWPMAGVTVEITDGVRGAEK